MSAASPKPQEKAPEPSMEEILASIRRIIADDQNAKSEEGKPSPPPLPENDDILDLAEVAQPARKPAPPLEEAGFEGADIDFDDISFGDEPAPEPAPPPRAAPAQALRVEPEPPRWAPPTQESAPQAPPMDRLVSDVTDASVGQAFTMLSHTVLSNNAQTIEDLVKDMLRPMLKGWLDDNLPSMVERLVRAEIERVSRGR